MIGTLKQMRDMRRLKREAKRSPSPATLGALAERFIACGKTDDARKVAERGLRRFPTSERLSSICTFAKKERMQHEIRRLRDQIEENPTPAAYTRLAEIYRSLASHDAALRTCEDCLERYPLNENPYLIIGEIHLERFLRDLTASDGLQAEAQLRRVARLNGQNLRAMLLLARLYHAVGAVDELRSTLDLIQGLAADLPELEQIEAGLDSVPDQDENLSAAERIRRIEITGEFPKMPQEFPDMGITRMLGGPSSEVRLDVEGLRSHLREVADTPGVKNSIILDRDGDTLADIGVEEGLTRKQFADMVAEVLKTAEDAARRMDMGSFRWCTVEGPFGGIAISKVNTISLGTMFTAPLRSDRARRLLEEFASRNFTASKEVAGA